MARTPTAPAPAGAADAIAVFVDSLRAGAAVLGFAVGFLATWRSGGAVLDSAFHGVIGALLLLPLGWFLGLVLARDAIRARVEDERATYERRLDETRRQIADHLRASGQAVPDGLLGPAGRPARPGLPPAG